MRKCLVRYFIFQKVVKWCYFNYKDVFSQKMIQANNFKFFVCQDPWCHNPNQYYESDIDSYLKTIKMKFDACKLKPVNNNDSKE